MTSAFWSGTLAAAGILAAAGSAQAVTLDVFDSGSDALLGSFEAPAGGGQVTTALFDVAGVLFDLIDPADVPEYRADIGDLTGPGATIFANFYNSAAGGGCAVEGCVLFFEKVNPGPPDAFVYGAINIDTFDNIAGGNYRIAAVPLPAGGALLLAGIAMAGWLRRKA